MDPCRALDKMAAHPCPETVIAFCAMTDFQRAIEQYIGLVDTWPDFKHSQRSLQHVESSGGTRFSYLDSARCSIASVNSHLVGSFKAYF